MVFLISPLIGSLQPDSPGRDPDAQFHQEGIAHAFKQKPGFF